MSRDLPNGWVVKTDVASYYPSIVCAHLVELLGACSVDQTTASEIERFLTAWSTSGIDGLPIGPEGSAILGTLFLLPVDQMLADASVPFLRFTDDIFAVVDTSEACTTVIDEIDATLNVISLRRNESKTEFAAVEDAKQRWFGASSGHPYDDQGGQSGQLDEPDTRLILGEQLASSAPDKRLLPRALTAATSLSLTDLVPSVLAATACLEQFPRASADFVLHCARTQSDFIGAALESALDRSPNERTHASDLHLIRASRGCQLSARDTRLVSVVDDQRRPVHVRAWAVQRASSAGCLSLDDLGDIACDRSADRLLRRTAIGSTVNYSPRARASLIRRFSNVPPYHWTARWVDSFG